MFTSGFRWSSWPAASCFWINSVEFVGRGPALRLSGPFIQPASQPASSGHLLRICGGCVARRRRSADQAGQSRYLSHHCFADHGVWSFSRALERARAYPRHIACSRRCEGGPASRCLGHSCRMHVGGRQHTHHLRDPQCWPQHCLSSVEYEQPARYLLGIPALQRAPSRRMEALARRPRWGGGDVRGSNAFGNCFFASGGARQSSFRDRGCAGRGDSLGHDVYPVPQGVSHGYESIVVRYVLHGRRTGDDADARHRLSRGNPALARVAQRPQRAFLVNARRICLGHRRLVSAIRYEVCRHQPRHPALEHKSVVGLAVGQSSFSTSCAAQRMRFICRFWEDRS